LDPPECLADKLLDAPFGHHGPGYPTWLDPAQLELAEPTPSWRREPLGCDQDGVARAGHVPPAHATKDTYISVALSAGVKIPWLEAQTGVRYETLRRHYGK